MSTEWKNRKDNGMKLRCSNKDLTEVQGTIGKVFLDNYDKLMAVRSSSEAHELVSSLFDEAGINTPKSREILFKLQRGMRLDDTLIYLSNIYLNAKGLGTMSTNKWYTCPDRNKSRI